MNKCDKCKILLYDRSMSRVRNKSKQLIGIALFQLLHRYNFDDISITQICEKAGVSRMSFYRYYSCKEDIFIVYSDERFNEFFELANKSNIANIEDLLLLIYREISKDAHHIKLLEKTNRFNILFGSFEQYASYLVARLENQSFSNLKNNHYLVPFLAGGIYSATLRWCHRNFIDKPEEVTAQTMQLLSHELN